MAHQYYFICPDCKCFAVTAETFKEFTTDDLLDRLEEALSQGAHFGVVVFDEHCPRCLSSRNQKWVLKSTTKVYWPKGMRRENL
jgi:hypothetical protein